MPQDEPEEVVLEGPDPRAWPEERDIWGPVTDIEAIRRAQAALAGPGLRDAGYPEAVSLLDQMSLQARLDLANALLKAYKAEAPPA